MKKRLSRVVVALILGVAVASSAITYTLTPVYAAEQEASQDQQQSTEKKEDKSAHSGHGH